MKKYYCGICWGECFPDGCGFMCNNCKHLLSEDQINWIGAEIVFDTKKADFVEEMVLPVMPMERVA